MKQKITSVEHITNFKQDNSSSNISRRRFIKSSLTALAASFVIGCNPSSPKIETLEPRLTARPGTPTKLPEDGLSELGLNSGRDGVLYVPRNYSPDSTWPLFVALHGAGGISSDWESYYDLAEEREMILMAPDSRGLTWDMIQTEYGPDLEFLDQALEHVFDSCNIDPTQLLLGGFSDGASYALSLGLSNGDLFTHLIGYSPGFVYRSNPIIGKPKIFISHGTDDNVLPVETTRDIIVPSLVNSGYDVVYREFEGYHQIPESVTLASLDWFLDGIQND